MLAVGIDSHITGHGSFSPHDQGALSLWSLPTTQNNIPIVNVVVLTHAHKLFTFHYYLYYLQVMVLSLPDKRANPLLSITTKQNNTLVVKISLLSTSRCLDTSSQNVYILHIPLLPLLLIGDGPFSHWPGYPSL